MNFLNRDKQRNLLKQCLDKIQCGIEECIWIEGGSGTGKTYFIKYMEQQEQPPVYVFSDYSWLYKCDSIDINNEFSYIIAIVSDMQNKHPSEFNKYLVNYFKDINNMSWIEILIHLLPNIKYTKWIKELIESETQKIMDAKNDISSRIYETGLFKFFAELIVYMLEEVEKKQNILFCIDDACWLDHKSIKTINIMLNHLRIHNKSNLKISFAIITRGKKELEPENSNYESLENTLKDYFESIQYIYIKNFDSETTKKYVEIMKKDVLLKKTTVIYKMTNGNPQELYQALKIDDDELLQLCENKKNIVSDRRMSNELIYGLAEKNIFILPTLACIALVHFKISFFWLQNLVKEICEGLHVSFNSLNYDKSLELLKENDLIINQFDVVTIVHDSIKELIIEYLKENGEYYCYMDSIAQGIKKESNFPNASKELFYLYSEYNPKKCFEYFVEKQHQKNKLDADIYNVLAKCIMSDGTLFNKKNMELYIIPIILKESIFLSLYDTAYNICCIIYPMKEQLEINIKFRFLLLFSKILIDMGFLNIDLQYNAIKIIDESLQIEKLNPSQKMEAYLLAMSAYEHILDFDKIILYNKKANQLYKSDMVSNYLKSMFLRNQGLVSSHIVLKNIYKQAIYYAESIDDIRKKNLMLGTCNNNLGLSYWYSSDIVNAKKHFLKAKHYLENIGYDIFRVLNNIAMCYLLEKDFSNAYNYLLQAKVLNTDCVFEKLCIQSNLSIIEWKEGKKESAKQLANQIYNEYINGTKQTTDELVYSSAMVNLGYFFYCEKKYFEAAKKYKESEFFEYRYNNEEQAKKRQAMVEACLLSANVLQKKEKNIEIKDNGQNVFKCMYAPIVFAYYII